MDVALINPRPRGAGLNEATVEPPLGLGYMAAMLEKNGISCAIIDANACGMSEQETLESLPAGARIIGLSMNSFTFSAVQSLARAIRAGGTALIIIGGPLPSADPGLILREIECDGVVRGEGEYVLLNIALRVNAGRSLFDGTIPGLVFRDENKGVIGPAPERIMDLDELPFPAFHLLPPLATYRTRSRKQPAAAIITSRGCAFDCSFCSKDIFQRKVTFRSAENVLAEIAYLVERYGIRQIDILDDNAAQNRERLERIMDGLIEADYGLAINMQTGIRTELLDEPLLRKMRKAGVFKLAFGVESADELVLRMNGKTIDLAKVKETAGKAKSLGFIVYGFFIIGLPGETDESLKKTLSFAVSAGFDLANFSMAIPFPGTELYRMVEEKGRFLFNTQRNIDSGFYARKVFFEYGDARASDILRRYDTAYKQFYSFTKRVSMVAGVRSLSELLWMLRAFISVKRGGVK